MQRGCNEGAMGMQRGCRGVQRGCSEDMQGGCSAVTVHRDVHRDAKDAEGPRLSLLPLEQLYLLLALRTTALLLTTPLLSTQ